jgi:hypothetical protein
LYPEQEPELRQVLLNKILEIKLLQFGIPKTELNLMTKDEILVLVHLVEYINKEAASKSNNPGEDVAV